MCNKALKALIGRMTIGVAMEFHSVMLCFMVEPGLDIIEKMTPNVAAWKGADVWLKIVQDMVPITSR